MNRPAPGIARGTAGPARGLAILMTPDYRADNPYQTLLARALEELGATVSFPRGYRRVLPLRRMLGQDGRRPDVLHLHWLTPYLKGGTAAAKMAYAAKLLLDVALVRRSGVRVVWTVHNLVEHEQAHPKIELWLRRRLARLADAIIVHSDEARALVSHSLGIAEGTISVIPHGEFGSFYGPPIPGRDARRQLGLPEAGRVFLFFGMVRPYKGVLKLLAAWASTPELHQEHVLVIAGRAPDAEHGSAVRAAAAGVPNVRLRLERVPDAEVPALFSAADIVALPFERCLTSGSAVLAQAYGRKIVTSLSPSGTREPGSGGSTISSPDPHDLARALCDAANDGHTPVPPERVDWQDIAKRLAETMSAQREPPPPERSAAAALLEPTGREGSR